MDLGINSTTLEFFLLFFNAEFQWWFCKDAFSPSTRFLLGSRGVSNAFNQVLPADGLLWRWMVVLWTVWENGRFGQVGSLGYEALLAVDYQIFLSKFRCIWHYLTKSTVWSPNNQQTFSVGNRKRRICKPPGLAPVSPQKGVPGPTRHRWWFVQTDRRCQEDPGVAVGCSMASWLSLLHFLEGA